MTCASRFRVLPDSVCSQRPRVLGFRIVSRAGCLPLPAVAMWRMFSNAAAVPKRTAAAALKLKVI